MTTYLTVGAAAFSIIAVITMALYLSRRSSPMMLAVNILGPPNPFNLVFFSGYGQEIVALDCSEPKLSSAEIDGVRFHVLHFPKATGFPVAFIFKTGNREEEEAFKDLFMRFEYGFDQSLDQRAEHRNKALESIAPRLVGVVHKGKWGYVSYRANADQSHQTAKRTILVQRSGEYEKPEVLAVFT